MKRDYFKRPLFHLAGKTAKWLHQYQDFVRQRRLKRDDQKWADRFEGNEFFIEQFSGVDMYFYKDSLLSKIIHDGHEAQEIEFVKGVLNEGDVFIDIGSNIGLFSLIAAPILGEQGMILAFEPTPYIFNRFQENSQLNGFKNIECRNIGLSDKKGTMSLHTSENGYDAWNSFAPGTDNKLGRTIEVEVSTLDEELEDLDKDRIKLVKIDVEGWEKFVLLGGETFFKKYSPYVMIEFTELNTFNAGYPVHDIYDILVDWGYKWYRMESNELVPESRKFRYPHVNLIAKK